MRWFSPAALIQNRLSSLPGSKVRPAERFVFTPDFHGRLKSCSPAWLVFFAALIIRFSHLLNSREIAYYRILLGDAAHFDRFSWLIAGGETAKHILNVTLSPVYLFFVSSIYTAFGHHLSAVYSMQILLDSLTCVMLYKITERLWDRPAALAAGFGSALTGIFVFYTTEIMKPALTLFLLTGFFWFMTGDMANERKRLLSAVGAGAALTASALLRMHIALFFPVLLIWAWKGWKLGAWGKTRFITVFILAGFSTFAFFNRWFDDQVPHKKTQFSQSGIHFYIGNKVDGRGSYNRVKGVRANARGHSEDARDIAAQATGAGRDITENEVNFYWLKRSLKEMASHPGQTLALYGKKLFLLLNEYEIPSSENYEYVSRHAPILKLPLLGAGLIIPFAILGMWNNAKRRSAGQNLLLGFAFSYGAALVLTFIRADYRLPLYAALIPFSAAGLTAFGRICRGPLNRRFAAQLALLCFLIVLCRYETHLRKDYYYANTQKQIAKEIHKNKLPAQEKAKEKHRQESL